VSYTGGTNTIKMLSGTSNVDIGSSIGLTQIFSNAGLRILSLSSAAQTNVACYNSGTGDVSYQTWASGCVVSSARFKENIWGISGKDAVSIIAGLKPVSYNYRPNSGLGDERHIGFIAEDVEKLDSSLVEYGKDGLPRSVKYNELWPLYAAAINQLKADNDNLRSRIDALENK
jgi:hypothetical protein